MESSFLFLNFNTHTHTGEITAAESLFTYSENQSAAFFSHSDHDPLFLDEVVASADNATLVTDACGQNAQCIYDAMQTDNIAVGLNTLDTMQQNENIQIQAGKSIIQF